MPGSLEGAEKEVDTYLAVSVKREEAEGRRKELRRLGLVDTSRKIIDKGDLVEIPVKGLPKVFQEELELVVQEGPVFRPETQDPYDRILAGADIHKDLKPLLPRKWELVGEVVLIKLPEALWDQSGPVAEAYAKELKAKAVLNDIGIKGEFREPDFELLWGEGPTDTVHLENQVRFSIDPMRVMFSSGNIDERIRMSTLPEEDEVVVDMFAGIGYFAVPMAVHSKAKRIIACEKNPVAYEYLVKNCELNQVTDKVEPLLGDNREVPNKVADRVVMGYLPTPRDFLSKAISLLKRSKSCIVHYHECVAENEIPGALYSRVAGAGGVIGRGARLLDYRWIKSYAPRIWHAVVDVEIM